MPAKKTKGERREEKKKPKMPVSGKSVFEIKKIITKNGSAKKEEPKRNK